MPALAALFFARLLIVECSLVNTFPRIAQLDRQTDRDRQKDRDRDSETETGRQTDRQIKTTAGKYVSLKPITKFFNVSFLEKTDVQKLTEGRLSYTQPLLLFLESDNFCFVFLFLFFVFCGHSVRIIKKKRKKKYKLIKN